MPAPITFALMAWGDIRFFASDVSWEGGRTQVVHELANVAPGQVHPRMDRGSRPRRTRLKIHFDDVPGSNETPQQTFERLEAAIDAGEVRIFTNPLGSSFPAAVGDFNPNVNEHSNVSADIEFVPDGEITQISPAGPSTSSTAGAGLVVAAASKLNQALADKGIGMSPSRIALLDFTKSVNLSVKAAFSVDLTVDVSLSVSAGLAASASATGTATGSASATASATAFADVYAQAFVAANAEALAQVTAMASANAFAFAYATAALTADAQAAATAWSQSDDLPPTQVLSDVARLSTGVGQMIDLGGLEQDIQLWLPFRAAIMLGGSIRSAAVAATVNTSATALLRVQDRISLLALAASVYGGASAQARADDIRRMNRISTPGWMDPGDYIVPARSSR